MGVTLIRANPLSIKRRLKKGYLILKDGLPDPDPKLSEFQQSRYRRAYLMADMYFRQDMTLKEISQIIGPTSHQMVSYVLKLAVEGLVRSGWLYEPEWIKQQRLRKKTQEVHPQPVAAAP